MPELEIVTPDSHMGKRWRSFSNYLFAHADSLCPLVVFELPKAAMHLPIAFATIDSQLTIVAVQGLEPGKNLLVTEDGMWRAGYVPAPYRSYPFLIGKMSDEQEVLCVDVASGLVTSSLEDQRFFGEDGKPAAKIAELLNFLTHLTTNRRTTNELAAMLQEFGLIEPWPITLTLNNQSQSIEGLFRINEVVLRALPSEQLGKLRDAGALPVIYCQLLSMQNISRLTQLMQNNNSTAKSSLPAEIDFGLPADSGNISFDGL